ncbi:hypothetical protein TSMEX_001029 [Taenia solium]|eukprot:TsM_000872900 transcript=TsM_000872900 gene=TsM_000872900
MPFLPGGPDPLLPSSRTDLAHVGAESENLNPDKNKQNSSNALSVDPRPGKPSIHEDEQWRSHPISMFWDKYRGENPEDRELPPKVRLLILSWGTTGDQKFRFAVCDAALSQSSQHERENERSSVFYRLAEKVLRK